MCTYLHLALIKVIAPGLIAHDANQEGIYNLSPQKIYAGRDAAFNIFILIIQIWQITCFLRLRENLDFRERIFTRTFPWRSKVGNESFSIPEIP